MKTRTKKNVTFGNELFYTKQGAAHFKKELKKLGMSYSTKKDGRGFYLVQYWKKR